MANNGRITTGSIPRALQYGVDSFIKHTDEVYPVYGDRLFQNVSTNGKAFYEVVQIAGTGLAGIKGQGDVINFDSIDQDWDQTFTVVTYNKSVRFTMEAIDDNVYDSQVPYAGEEIRKSLNISRDWNMANILNNAFSTGGINTGPDGKALCDTAHPLQAGGTNGNRLSTDLDLSEDAVEQGIQTIDKFLTPEGIEASVRSKFLVVPVALEHEAARICKSKYQTQSANNDPSAIYHRGDIEDYMVWKRLTAANTWFITTDLKRDGLILVRHKEVETKTFQEPYTFDTIITAYERYLAAFANYRCIFGSNGP